VLEVQVGDGTKNLHTDAGTLTFTLTVGGQIQDGAALAITKAAGVLRAGYRTRPFYAANGATVTLQILSSNANDDDVDVTVTPRVVVANTVQVSGTAQTARDLGTSVLISSGTGTGQLSVTSGVISATVPDTQKVDVNTIKTQAVTCAAGVTVRADVGAAAAPGAANGMFIAGSNAATTVNITGTISTVTTLTNLPAITTDWLTAAGVKADAVTKIQAGLATPTNITAGTITTVTNLTNLPAVTTDWLTAAGVKADAVAKIQTGLATPTNITAGTITTVTNLTNLPAATTDWLTAAAVKADAVTKIQSGLSTLTQAQVTGGAYDVTNVSCLVHLAADQAVNASKIGGQTATAAGAITVGAYVGNATAAIAVNGSGYVTYANTAPPSASDIKTALEADGSKIDHLWEMTADDGGTRQLTANALELAPSGGATAAAIAAAMFSENAGTYAAAHANSVVKQTANNAGGSSLTESGIADAVWDEATSGHTSTGTFGKLIGTLGVGAYSFVITVNDGTNALENASVRLINGVTTLSGQTDAAGQVTFGVDAGTWAVTITLAGYQFTPTTKVISGAASQTYSMTAVAIPAPARAAAPRRAAAGAAARQRAPARRAERAATRRRSGRGRARGREPQPHERGRGRCCGARRHHRLDAVLARSGRSGSGRGRCTGRRRGCRRGAAQEEGRGLHGLEGHVGRHRSRGRLRRREDDEVVEGSHADHRQRLASSEVHHVPALRNAATVRHAAAAVAGDRRELPRPSRPRG
jgi:hypothetical protein